MSTGSTYPGSRGPVPTPAEPKTAAGERGFPGGRSRWESLAERGRATLPAARFTIQLELVCELSSLEEAWKWVFSGVPAAGRNRPLP